MSIPPAEPTKTPIKPLPRLVQKLVASVWPEIEQRLDQLVTVLLAKLESLVAAAAVKAGEGYVKIKGQVREYLGMRHG